MTLKKFDLPMNVTVSYYAGRSGKIIAHALDFDLVGAASTQEEAEKKIRFAIKTYIEYGLSKNSKEDIIFPAPSEFWDQLFGKDMKVGEPIFVNTRKMMFYQCIITAFSGSVV